MTQKKSGNYNLRGVSATKEEVHAAAARLPQPLFPRAFCRVYPDHLTGSEEHGVLVHGDGVGTKAALAYLVWKETGNSNVWHQLARDVVVMNTDDVFCTAAPRHLLYCSLINRNKHLIPGAVLQALIDGTLETFADLERHGVFLHYMGGETADVGDAVRTLTVDATVTCRLLRHRIIKNEIQAGDAIVGLASAGQTHYESAYNSGMGCNGLTSARHDVLHADYGRRYPETADPLTDSALIYAGSRKITDVFMGHTVADLLLSPTRTYVPFLLQVHEQFFEHVHGIIHCTGGGQTKVLHYIDQLHVIKDQLFSPPPVFQLILQESRAPLRELYAVFNMGHRLEVYCHPAAAEKLIQLAASFGIPARVIGRVEASATRRLTIHTETEVLVYS